MKVGLFLDAPFRSENGKVWSGGEALGFGRFATAVGAHLGGLRLIARGTESSDETPYELPGGAELCALPYYESLRDLPRMIKAFPTITSALWRSLEGLDLVWISTAAHPFGLILLLLARLRRKRVALLVRQDTMAYFRSRLPGPRWKPILAPLWLMDRLYRLLSRGIRTTVVGTDIEASLGGPRENLLTFQVNLFSSDEVVGPRTDAWGGAINLLTVGRIEPEKNPLLAVEMLGDLEESEPGRYSFTWVGTGSRAAGLATAAEAAGLGDRIALPGFVPAGEALTRYYDRADLFVHISLTEGVPGVIGEAMARGLPVVATDVGGVRGAAAGAALLVQPGDARALAGAVRELVQDPELRRRLSLSGSELASHTALDIESRKVADFLALDE